MLSYEEVYRIIKEQVDNIKSVNGIENHVIVFGRDFKVNKAGGYSRQCQIWSKINGRMKCIGVASLHRCRNFEDVKRKIAEKIAIWIYKEEK